MASVLTLDTDAQTQNLKRSFQAFSCRSETSARYEEDDDEQQQQEWKRSRYDPLGSLPGMITSLKRPCPAPPEGDDVAPPGKRARLRLDEMQKFKQQKQKRARCEDADECGEGGEGEDVDDVRSLDSDLVQPIAVLNEEADQDLCELKMTGEVRHAVKNVMLCYRRRTASLYHSALLHRLEQQNELFCSQYGALFRENCNLRSRPDIYG